MFFDTNKQYSPQSFLVLSQAKDFLLEKYGLTPNDERLFLTSFIHKSHARDFVGNYAYNERLEFLGDAVLGHCVVDFLYKNFSDDESILALYKVFLIREETLAAASLACGINQYILLSHGEEQAGGRTKDVILADCLEAFFGYISMDFDYDTVYRIIYRIIIEPRISLLKPFLVKNAKSIVQEYSQSHWKKLPIYEVLPAEYDTIGNIVLYRSSVLIPDGTSASGLGKNKKQAEDVAARARCDKYLL